MKRTLTTLALVALAFGLKSQVVFESFDAPVESRYEIMSGGLTDSSSVFPSMENAIISEGEGALLLDYNIESAFSWGGAGQLRMRHPEAQGRWDFSGYESLSIDFYNKVPSSAPGRATLQIIFFDASELEELAFWGLLDMEWWISTHDLLDLEEGWNSIELSLEDIGVSGSTGFYLQGNSGVMGNSMLDLDQIRAIAFGVVVTGPQDSAQIAGQCVLDNFVFYEGTSTSSLSGQPEESQVLAQNYPNPFQQETRISYSIAHQQHVKLSVFDVSGREVDVLVNETLSPGEYQHSFHAGNLSNGIYYYQLQAGATTATRKMLIKR